MARVPLGPARPGARVKDDGVDAIEVDLRKAVEAVTPRLLVLSEGEAAKPPSPGKWSPKEVIGHLIDSASNNHQRFVRARFTDDLVFPGYEQEAWVAAQRYQSAPWADLVGLWRLLNLHLARVVEATPEAARHRVRTRHNLHQIAWKTIAQDQPATLEYFMRDYVGHLEHHLAQILGPLDAATLRELATRYTAAWCSRDPARVAAFFAEDGSLKINDGSPSIGRAAIAAAARGFTTAFPDMVVTMDDVGVEGSKTIYRWTLTGTNTGPAGTGRAVRMSGHEEWKIGAGGLIAESKGHFDEAEYRRQLSGS